MQSSEIDWSLGEAPATGFYFVEPNISATILIFAGAVHDGCRADASYISQTKADRSSLLKQKGSKLNRIADRLITSRASQVICSDNLLVDRVQVVCPA